jgi:hypothetical protein
MKKTVCCAVLALTAAAVFAHSLITMEVNSGRVYRVVEGYTGKYQGQVEVNKIVANAGWYEKKLTKDIQEVMEKVLGKYVTATGDTYVIGQLPDSADLVSFTIVVEFTSATQYKYWLLERGTR